MWKTRLKNIAWGFAGVLLALVCYRAVLDYSDFLKMRAWVAAVQQNAAQQQAQQAVPPSAPQP